MKNTMLQMTLISGLMIAGAAGHAQTSSAAKDPGLIVVESAHSLATTEGRLAAALERAGLKVAARVDHAANAKGGGLDLPATALLIFGNPKAGTVLMEKSRTIGIDLPLKVLIWESNGTVKLAYNDPAYIAHRHGLTGTDPTITQMQEAMQKLASAATGQ